jgi:hypothetical protein
MSKSMLYYQKKYRITPLEYEFFIKCFYYTRNGEDKPKAKQKAYLDTHPDLPRDSKNLSNLSSRLYSAIYDKFGDNFADFMEIAGCGRDRLQEEIDKGLEAKYTKFFKGRELGEMPDNSTRAKTRELMAKTIGVLKNQVEVTEKKELDIDLSVYTVEELEQLKALLAKGQNEDSESSDD